MKLSTALALYGGGPGSGRKPYGKKDHDDFKKQIVQWKKELKSRRDLSKSAQETELANRIFPSFDKATGAVKGQEELDHVKTVAESIRKKDPTVAEYLDNVHESLTDDKGRIDHYGDKARAHGYLKMAEKEFKGISDKLPPNLVKWIKMSKAKGFDSDESDDDED